MKILYVAGAIPLPGTSGGATHVLEVAHGLARRGHRLHVMARGQRWTKVDTGGAFDVTLMPFPDKLAYLALPEVYSIARHFAPDVIMERYYNFAGAGMTVAKRRHIPSVLEVNAPMVDPPGSPKSRLDRLLGGRLRHWAVTQGRWSRRIVTPLATTVPPEVPRSRIELVNWGANVDQFHPGLRVMREQDIVDLHPEWPPAVAAVFRAVRRMGDAVIIAFVGSFRTWHGVDVLADAALRLIPQHPNLTFLAIGGGPELEPVRARVAAAGLPPDRFLLPGPVKHSWVPSLLALADIGVAPFVPSVYAPLRTFGFYWSPLKVFEYMAMVLPVITQDIPPLNTIISAGEEGLLYREGDLATLTAHIAALAADPAARARLGRAARARVVAHYSWDAHCAQLERVLEDVKRDA
jgi:glycosyltransferase involved in cell wall biosynthesis